jgi:hypothetical protein
LVAAALVLVGGVSAAAALAAPTSHPYLRAFTAPTVPAEPHGRVPVDRLRLMNYYPADAGWTLMWTHYSHARTVADLQAIASLGANAVRVIVQPSALGYPTPDSTMLANFRDLLATARSARLGVQLTLFDWWNSYGDVAGSETWLRSLLAGQARNPAIALVELQNEIPLGNATAIAWARTLMPYLSTVLPGVPRTLSVAGSAGAAGIATLIADLPPSAVDVIDVHYYGDASGAADVIRTAQSVAVGRPVIVGEAGLSTPDGAAGEEAQARFYRVLERTTVALGIPPAAPWTLTDFTATGIPNDPGTNEYHFGLRRLNGTWKPAAAVVKESFAGVVDGDLDGGFERESNSGSSRLGAWTQYDTADGAGQVAGDVVRTGLQSLCFSSTSGHSTAVPSVLQRLPVLTAGERFTVTTYVDRLAPTGVERIALAWFTSDGRYLGQIESPAATESNTWQSLTVAGAAPVGASTVQVHLKAAYERGRACYDDTTISG